jgi:hypothetical protein
MSTPIPVQAESQSILPKSPPYPLSEEAVETLKAEIVQALRGIYDPEIPVNIYDLGLIYEIEITPEHIPSEK